MDIIIHWDMDIYNPWVSWIWIVIVVGDERGLSVVILDFMFTYLKRLVIYFYYTLLKFKTSRFLSFFQYTIFFFHFKFTGAFY